MNNVKTRSKQFLLIVFIVFATFNTNNLYSQDTIKVLAVGNSFSVDGVENYLHELAKTEGITLIIGNLYIKGCSLETN